MVSAVTMLTRRAQACIGEPNPVEILAQLRLFRGTLFDPTTFTQQSYHHGRNLLAKPPPSHHSDTRRPESPSKRSMIGAPSCVRCGFSQKRGGASRTNTLSTPHRPLLWHWDHALSVVVCRCESSKSWTDSRCRVSIHAGYCMLIYTAVFVHRAHVMTPHGVRTLLDALFNQDHREQSVLHRP
ncbi:hypothetical protein IG631_21254 [Alternaria alternata]|nr:hypothetical protein IG631_21254 [Alternaria alternata]